MQKALSGPTGGMCCQKLLSLLQQLVPAEKARLASVTQGLLTAAQVISTSSSLTLTLSMALPILVASPRVVGADGTGGFEGHFHIQTVAETDLRAGCEGKRPGSPRTLWVE